MIQEKEDPAHLERRAGSNRGASEQDHEGECFEHVKRIVSILISPSRGRLDM